MLYSYRLNPPIGFEQIPDRIRLSDGTTRTGKSSFTQQELESAGFTPVDPAPGCMINQKVVWTGSAWQVVDLTEAERQSRMANLLSEIRTTRKTLFQDLDARYSRYFSQQRLGLQPVDNLQALDQYAQALRDITSGDITNIQWPAVP